VGSTYQAYTHDHCSESELRTWFDGLIRNAKQEYGSNVYSGKINIIDGLTISPKPTFDSIQAADDYLDDGDSGSAIAVRARVPAASFRDARPKEFLRLTETLHKAEIAAINGDKTILATIRSKHTASRACVGCKSRIVTAFVRTWQCPVCGDKTYVFKRGELAQRGRLHDAVAKARARMEESRKAYELAAGSKIVWRIGAWCKS
jgi:predicted RNA-binding Zn-ribbon protein involved in translation (DUF1610 family)